MLSTIISLLLTCICLVLSLYSLLRAPWTSFDLNEKVYTHSLFYSIQVPDVYDRADYVCLKALTCKHTASDLCNISSKLTLARTVFISFEILALALQLFIIERLLLKLFNKPYGSANYFLFLIWALPLIKSIGIVIFLILSDVNFDSSSTRGEIKAEYGIYINFASIFVSILTSLLMIFFKVHRTTKLWRVQIKVSTGKFFNPMLMYMITQVLFILSNVYPTVSYNEFMSVKINIDHVSFMENYPDDLPIQCIAGQECRISEYSCKVFNSLATTSNIVTTLRAFSYIFALLWGESFLHLLIKIRLGTNFLNVIYPILYFTLNLIGFVVYCVKSNLGYGARCNIEEFEKSWVLCAELGTTFYIITIIFSFLTVVTYVLIYAIYSTRAGFGKEQKVMEEPNDDNDLKKKNVNVLDQTDLDNSAIKTSPNIRMTSTPTVNTVQTIPNKECYYCKKGIGIGEPHMNEGNNLFHTKCYLLEENIKK